MPRIDPLQFFEAIRTCSTGEEDRATFLVVCPYFVCLGWLCEVHGVAVPSVISILSGKITTHGKSCDLICKFPLASHAFVL